MLIKRSLLKEKRIELLEEIRCCEKNISVLFAQLLELKSQGTKKRDDELNERINHKKNLILIHAQQFTNLNKRLQELEELLS